MSEWCREEGVEIWSYCLMPNHVHLIAVPKTEDGLRRAIGEAHRRYTRRINFREKWRGYLWQGRFASFIMDEPYLLAAARYVELNPVRAKLATKAREWPWSSARAHLSGRDDRLVKVAPLLKMVGDWKAFLNSAIKEEELQDLREHGRTGRPLGSSAFLDRLENLVGRVLKRLKPGPKPKSKKSRIRK
jgi:putative transposase